MDQNNDTNFDKNEKKNNTWDLLRQARQIQKEQNRIKNEERRKLVEQKKKEKKARKIKCKEEIKVIKTEIKKLNTEYNKELKTLKLEFRKNKTEDTRFKIENCKDAYHQKKIEQKEKIYEINFNFGKEYNTIWWQFKKGLLGIKKEFNRVVWSRPVSTFKYLLIIIVIIAFLSLIFFLITFIVDYI